MVAAHRARPVPNAAFRDPTGAERWVLLLRRLRAL